MISLQIFNRHNDKLTVEASTIGKDWQPNRLLQIKSHKTNRIVIFVYQGEEKDNDNDVVCWNFTNTKDTDQPIRKVVVWND